MKRDGYCFEKGGLMKGEIFGKPISNSRRDCHELGEGAGATVIPARNPKNLAAITEVHLSAETTGTSAAINRGIKSDAIAWLEGAYVFAHRIDDSSGFVPHDDWRNAAPGRAVVAVNIAAADSAGGYANQQLVSADSGYGNVRDLKMTIFR